MAKRNNAVNLARDYNKQFSSLFSDEVKCCDNYDLQGVTENFTSVTSVTISNSLLVKNQITVYDSNEDEISATVNFSADGKTAVIDFGGATKTGTVSYFIKKY